jgi:hypothetical protein
MSIKSLPSSQLPYHGKWSGNARRGALETVPVEVVSGCLLYEILSSKLAVDCFNCSTSRTSKVRNNVACKTWRPRGSGLLAVRRDSPGPIDGHCGGSPHHRVHRSGYPWSDTDSHPIILFQVGGEASKLCRACVQAGC